MRGGIGTIAGLFRPSRLTGPILDKELRVSSRRKRSYLLRCLYLAILLILVVLSWFPAMSYIGSTALGISRMSEVSRFIVNMICWFQFIAAQIVALILCCAAMNSEIHNRTLQVLMTTPITSFQIVMGKLLSRLWQILLLLGISLPVLAMLRVFGGIPWPFLVASLCMTASAVLLVSVVTLYFSVRLRRAYAVMIFSVIAMGIVFGLIPFLLFLCVEAFDWLDEDILEEGILYTNPYVLMFWKTDQLFSARSISPLMYWPWQCAFLAGCAGLVFWRTCRVVRTAVLRQLVPRSERKEYTMPPRQSKTYWLRRPIFLHSLIERTIGTGMIWKEFLHPVLGRFRKVAFGALIGLLSGFLISVFIMLLTESIYLVIFLFGISFFLLTGLAVLFTLTIPAAYISGEKEAGTWLILLTTCYTDGQILGGKIVGILRRIALVWLPFILIFFFYVYYTEAPLLFWGQILLVFLSTVGFVVCSGLYFSSRFRHSTTAVICNLSLAAILWIGLPGLFSALRSVTYEYNFLRPLRILFDGYWRITPPGMMADILENFDPWYFPEGMGLRWIFFALVHALAVLLFLWRTKANLRKRIA